MSRKTYIAAAAVVKDALDAIREDEANGVADNIEPDAVAMTIAYGLAEMFKAENSRFDRERFLTACGLS